MNRNPELELLFTNMNLLYGSGKKDREFECVEWREERREPKLKRRDDK